MKSPLSRRTLLRGAGGVAIALPFLDAMAPRRAMAAGPKRLFLMHNQNGVVPGAWFPTGGEKDFKLAPAMMPFEPLRQHLVILDGIDKQENRDNGTAHARGMASTFTGNTSKDGFADGPSIEQPIANAIGAGTRIKYLLAGKVSNYHVFHSGPRMMIPPVDDPKANFDRLFTGFTPPAAAGGGGATQNPDMAVLRARKKSILDHALEEYKRVSAEVGAGDRKRLDVHAETIRQIERGLLAGGSAPAAAGAACKVPEVPSTAGAYLEHGQANMQLLTLALACDITRVVGMQWTSHGTAFSWLGVTTLHHPLAHQTGNAGADAQLTKILTWHAQQAADALTRLKSYQEGDGTVLDSTLFVWGNEISTGSHRFPRAPYLMATGKLLQTGRYLKFNNLPHPTVLVSVANTMGLPITSFGNGGWQKGALPGL
ncbi:MAG TPA: DUF1552 domain-containing protein [Polyangia bacterium]|nr:DUF1552 domain-containing protein [Polyangia bacterium]